jgi:hypothetical protein
MELTQYLELSLVVVVVAVVAMETLELHKVLELLAARAVRLPSMTLLFTLVDLEPLIKA